MTPLTTKIRFESQISHQIRIYIRNGSNPLIMDPDRVG
jgi:hypothetical protein